MRSKMKKTKVFTMTNNPAKPVFYRESERRKKYSSVSRQNSWKISGFRCFNKKKQKVSLS